MNADPEPMADVVVAGRRLRVVPSDDKCPEIKPVRPPESERP